MAWKKLDHTDAGHLLMLRAHVGIYFQHIIGIHKNEDRMLHCNLIVKVYVILLSIRPINLKLDDKV